MATIKCCFNCPDRTPACHSKCERYQKEREDWEQQKEKIKKVRGEENYYSDRFKNRR